MDFLKEYVETISQLPKIIFESEMDNIVRAASIIANATKTGNLVHIFGTGAHSSMAGEEFFLRPGSLMNINPIFDPGLSLSHGAYRSWMIELLTGYAKPVMDYYYFKDGDVIIIVNAYGINCVTIDAAMEAKKRNLTVIAITSKDLAGSVPKDFPSRHPCKKSLHELEEVDVVIDLHIPAGDAVVQIPGMPQKTGPVSTISYCIVLGLLNSIAVKLLHDDGFEPDVIMNPYSNAKGSENNEKMIEKYYEIIKHL